MSSSSSSFDSDKGGFATTRWSIVGVAGGARTVEGRVALEQLCSIYWQPVYVYIRRKGYQPSDAQDLTQGFFTDLLEKESIGVAEPTRGRFRTFLLACLANYLHNAHREQNALKRGGGRKILQVDFSRGDEVCSQPVEKSNPESEFEKGWALALIEAAWKQLKQDWIRSGKEELFQALRKQMMGAGNEAYKVLAERFGMTEGGVKVAAHRLRQQYADALLREVSATVGDAKSAKEELEYLIAVVSRE